MTKRTHTFLDATPPTDGRGKISFSTVNTPAKLPLPKKPKRKKLVSLDKWNADHTPDPPAPTEYQKNGIACPKCGDELYDTSPKSFFSNMNGTYTNVGCACGWIGDRRV